MELTFCDQFKSPFFLIQAFARQVISRQPVHGTEGGQQDAGDPDVSCAARRAHVVNIADWRGVRPGTDHVAYTLTKAALIAMTQSMALALAPHIQVNAIAPGLILPPPGKGPEYLEQNAPKIPARRVGSADEIVQALLFLLGSDFVTGELIYVTGGEHLLAGRGA